MAIVIIATSPGMTAEHYAAMNQEGTLANALPDGCMAQIGGPSPDGWQVISVWESPEAANTFHEQVIAPMMEAAGIPTSEVPPVVYPVHRFLTA